MAEQIAPLIFRHIRKWQIAVVLAIVGIAVLANFFMQYRYLHLQRQWLDYNFPSNHVAFGANDDEHGSGPPYNARNLKPLIHPDRELSFAHSRRSAGGEVRLVLVENYVLSNAPRGPTTLAIEASVYSVAGWRIGSRIEFVSKTLFMFSFADKEQLKLFAGQIDPADSSHFTFDYEISSAATQYGTIDCWLNTNDGVTFRQTINTAPKK